MASTLPQREQNSFKALFKFYENKQYKKGLKTANEILKKFPEHGETLCMKGLILSYLNKKEEAYEFVRLGLKKDLKSHVCWHIYGLLYRADRNYEEAIKCYRNALRIDKDNFQILKDLAVLEVQTRNMDGFIETRQQLLTSKSQQKGSWVGLAVAYHIAGNYDMAIKVMDMYESTQQPPNPMVYDFEVSELVLYKNSLYEESGQYQAGLNHLLANEKVVFDTLALKETHVRYLIKLDRLKEAAELQLSLINGNPENQKYYPVYEQAKGIQATDIDARIALLKEISAAYPKANTPKRLLLDLLAGDELKSSIDKYLRSFLSKGAPSLFVTVKPVYKRDGVAATVTTLLDGYLKNLALSPSKFTAEDAETQSPTTFLWTLYYAAQHYAFLGNHALALTLIDQAINHTPTVVEIVQGKAKILKMAGDIEGAAKTSNEARLLDLQDRFINTKATKYLLRNDQVSNADEVVGLFAKGDQTTQTNNLAEMQASWYAIEAGKSFARQKQFGKALKKFHDVQKFFQDYVDDQFDFHSYSLRKMTLRSYIR